MDLINKEEGNYRTLEGSNNGKIAKKNHDSINKKWNQIRKRITILS